MWTNEEKIMVCRKIHEVRNIMVQNGFPVKPVVEVKYSNAITVYGRCAYNGKDNTVTITISEVTLRDNSLLNTIIHELCHAVDVPNNNHHNYVWKQLAYNAGKLFNENIVRCAKDSKEHIAMKKSRYRYTIKCEHCGHEYHYIRESHAIKNILKGNSRKYHCKCGSYDLKVYSYNR